MKAELPKIKIPNTMCQCYLRSVKYLYFLLVLATLTLTFQFVFNSTYLQNSFSQVLQNFRDRTIFTKFKSSLPLKIVEEQSPTSKLRYPLENSITNSSFYSIASSQAAPFTLLAPAILLHVKGGIGNQLFEYACHYALARKHNLPLYIAVPSSLRNNLIQQGKSIAIATNSTPRTLSVWDRSFALDRFNVPLFPWNTIDSTWTIPNVTMISDPDILSGSYYLHLGNNNPAILSGYDFCQSETYFAHYRDEVREIFALKTESILSQDGRGWLKIIEEKGKTRETVGIHIRRGDFVSLNAAIPLSYYVSSLTDILANQFAKQREFHKNVSIFIFSDDVVFVRDKLIPALNVGHNLDLFVVSDPTKFTSLEEFYLLSKCKHFIIPNSSFSWWAAYLGKDKNKIVYAAHFRDEFITRLYPRPEDRRIFFVWQYKHIYYPTGWNAIEPIWGQE